MFTAGRRRKTCYASVLPPVSFLFPSVNVSVCLDYSKRVNRRDNSLITLLGKIKTKSIQPLLKNHTNLVKALLSYLLLRGPVILELDP